MLPFIPSIFPDELFYSWLARYHRFSGNNSPVTTMKELFNKKNSCLNIHFPFNIEFLIKQFPENLTITADRIINKYTIFPYLRVFMKEEDIDEAMKAMKYDIRYNFMDRTGINEKNIFDINVIKVCPSCYDEDKNVYGEAYIHRQHQVPGNFICIKHMKYLVNYKIPSNTPKNEFININQCEIDFHIEHKELSKEIINLSKDIEYILNLDDEKLNLDEINKKYDTFLKNSFYKHKANVNQGRIAEDLIQYYSKDFLKHLNSFINVKDQRNWIKSITTNLDKRVNPIRHLLLIRFLSGSVENFIKEKVEESPFGEGPWPCLNPISSHFRERVIQDYSISNHNREKSGTFKCYYCGFVYTRKLKSGKYELSSISDFGSVWQNKLIELLKQHKTVKEISKIMKCNDATVRKYGRLLGILKCKSNCLKNKVYVNNDDKLVEYKEKINRYITKNRGKGRAEIRKALIKEYDYVMRKDRYWIENTLPAKLDKRPPSLYKNWPEIDVKLSVLVEKAIKEILEDEKIIQITIYSIARRCEDQRIRKKANLDRMPKTKQAILDGIETTEDFKKRKLKRIIKSLVENGEAINKTKIMRRIYIEKEEYEKFKPFIEQYIRELKGEDKDSVIRF